MHEIPQLLRQTLAGRYVLKREIGRGGAATVYLAHDIRHERMVAVKVLHPELSHALGAQRFMREIKLTASLQHPHILSIHDSGEADAQLYYVMPFVEGESLRQRLGAASRLSVEEAVRIGREVAGALAYAHERGVVHRDIKPENILFSGGHAVLADFGIARAINRASEKITQQGTITGTPAYMSPEQARDRAFDGRSDVYSLACVLYEAIAGVPPFVGDTPQQLLSQRIVKTPPLLREYRHDVPPPIETVIAKALSISPDDRYDDARAFSAALSAAVGNSGETLTARPVRRRLLRNPLAWVAGFAVLAAGAVGTSASGRNRIDLLTGRIDTAQYAVVPFQYVGTAAPTDGQELVAQGLYAAMRDWNGVKLASDMGVVDAMSRASDQSLEGVLGVAREMRAGKLIWGRVWLTRDSVRVRAGVYNTVDGTSLREATMMGPRTLLSGDAALRMLAIDLLRLEGAPRGLPGSPIGTRSVVAWHAYQRGQMALGAWDIPAALAAFDRAIEADPEYGTPHVWRAQLLVWQRRPLATWTGNVSVARRVRPSLDVHDAFITDALSAVQGGDYQGACAAYGAMRDRDSLDVVAWLGLTQCQMNDRLVRRDKSGGTWGFRGSMRAAQAAYIRALQLAPGAFAALPSESLRNLFVVESNITRVGFSADSAMFLALPDLVRDTLAYVAHPIGDAGRMSFAVMAPNYTRALDANRDALLTLLATLTQRLPDNPDVFEALARVLESRDDISGTPNGGHSALSALEQAKRLAVDPVQRARLGAMDVRIHLKLGDFSRVLSLGDSLMDASAGAAGDRAATLAGIAALLGQEGRAVTLLRASGGTVTSAGRPMIPLLEDVGASLFVRSSLGVCDDSLRALRGRVGVLLDSYVSATEREAVRANMLQRPLILGLPCFGAPSTLSLEASFMPIMLAAQSLGRGETARVRVLLDSMQQTRPARPGDYSLDFMVADSWMRAAVGDSANAIRQLDLTLTALPTLSPHIVTEAGMAAAVGRAMVLRADLAAARGDGITASLWASRVLTLWAHSDASLAPTLARMRATVARRA